MIDDNIIDLRQTHINRKILVFDNHADGQIIAILVVPRRLVVVIAAVTAIKPLCVGSV